MKNYDHKQIEKKWQKQWAESGIYKIKENSKKPKSYVLDMFPYPSGEGLHVGHPKGFIATDIYSRMKTMQGHSVLHPMGWDAFGLPAENYAIKNKVHPKIAVKKNIKRYKDQLEKIGFNYDWSREIDTTDPEYYKWTQWIFLQMFKAGLAYESHEPINWCPSCQTGLANEDLEDGKCERCSSEIELKPMRQWVLKITDYADRLLADLEELDWPTHIKESQKNWIGKSEGALIEFKLKTKEDFADKLEVFTTRPDTIFGVTFMAISVSLAKSWLENGWSVDNKINDKVKKYITKTTKDQAKKSFKDDPDKTGINTGLKAVNPINDEEIPIWITNYVLNDVGTGAIMAVPAHDERDFLFAKKYDLPIKEVIESSDENLPFLEKGKLINSEDFNNLSSEEASKKIVKKIKGKFTHTYKLKDWVFSRQRYWGEPIPLIHCGDCGVVPVPESDLPVKLPQVKSYAPTGTGESPLADIKTWVNTTCPECGGKAKRETNTMPQWAGSSWYYLRYMDPDNNEALVDPKKEKYWAPVDVYVGGTEHATRHLIYARFWHKFLYDIKVVSTPEPFARIGKSLGLILGADGRKMSKRWGNVVNPDEVVGLYGADTLRVYEMFMGPFDQEISWSTESMIGSRRFLEKVWRLQDKVRSEVDLNKKPTNEDLEILLNQTIKKVEEDIESFSFNTAVSSLMILVNSLEKEEAISTDYYFKLLKILAPFSPHITEELWHKLKPDNKSVHLEKWPTFDDQKLTSQTIEIVVQVNGKFKYKFKASRGLSESKLKDLATDNEKIKDILTNSPPKKVIIVPDRLINFVI